MWGDFEEKVAFDLSVNGANILGAITGGFAGSKTYDHIKNKKEQKQMNNVAQGNTIESNHYDNIQTIMRDLKIVFTPINIVYSVNGQVFEIIKSSEMSPEMKERFLAKDGGYFTQLIINKMNMELQLAEQIFARKLLQPHITEQFKEANFVSALIEKVASQDFDLTFSDQFEKVASSNEVKVRPSLDSLRPFSSYPDFFAEKIANVIGIAEPLPSSIVESFSANDMKKRVRVGFLPDRVIYLLNGNLVEQMTVMQMNEDGYEAFKKRDKNFFLDFFHDESKNISESIFKDIVEQQLPSADSLHKEAQEGSEDVEVDFEDDVEVDLEDDLEDDIEKEAATLEEVIESMDRAWIEQLATERDHIQLFYDNDIHPLVYDVILDRYIYDDWHTLELEAVLKEIEVTFGLTEAIGNRALDKIASLHTIQNEGNSMFDTSFSFEKFLRAMNNKTVLITTFEGGNEFEEIIYALDIAKAVCGGDIFLSFGKNIPAYVAEELFRDNIRYVSDQVYDEDNEVEDAFWEDVNDILLRKWKERDSKGLELEESKISRLKTEQINIIGERVLAEFAEFTEFEKPYESVSAVLHERDLLSNVEDAEGVEQAIVHTIGRHLIGALFLEVKREEAIQTVLLFEEDE